MDSRCLKWARVAAGAMCVIASAPATAALVVSPISDPGALASALISGSGFSVSGASLVGGNQQQGTFSDGLSVGGLNGIGIGSGVILTSGDAMLAPGPNNRPDAGAQPGPAIGSTSILSALFVGTPTTFDENILSFTFIPSARGDLVLNFVFASEEYNAFVGTGPSDVFGLFVDGVNRALVPGTTDLISVNTVNCGSSARDTPPPGTGPNCDRFVNNDFDVASSPPFDIQYDGFTTVFTSSLTGLVPGQRYAITLAIADVGDQNLDSAVFIAGRFEAAPPNGVPEPGTVALLGVSLLSLLASGRRLQKSPA